MSLKNSNDTNGNRTRNLPVCTPPRAPNNAKETEILLSNSHPHGINFLPPICESYYLANSNDKLFRFKIVWVRMQVWIFKGTL